MASDSGQQWPMKFLQARGSSAKLCMSKLGKEVSLADKQADKAGKRWQLPIAVMVVDKAKSRPEFTDEKDRLHQAVTATRLVRAGEYLTEKEITEADVRRIEERHGTYADLLQRQADLAALQNAKQSGLRSIK